VPTVSTALPTVGCALPVEQPPRRLLCLLREAPRRPRPPLAGGAVLPSVAQGENLSV
jgi:hypothetical protein